MWIEIISVRPKSQNPLVAAAVAVAEKNLFTNNMKKILLFLIIFFIIYSTIVCLCPLITQWDTSVIVFVQKQLHNLPIIIPVLLGTQIYSACIFLPLIIGFIYFFKELLIIDLLLFCSSPLVAYITNTIIKNIIKRPRPPKELQSAIQLDNYSFTSNHTLIICTLWSLSIFYLIKYCKNPILKTLGISFAILIMILVGFSRIWLGVHNPTDVLGGYFLAAILVYIYTKLIKLIGGK